MGANIRSANKLSSNILANRLVCVYVCLCVRNETVCVWNKKNTLLPHHMHLLCARCVIMEIYIRYSKLRLNGVRVIVYRLYALWVHIIFARLQRGKTISICVCIFNHAAVAQPKRHTDGRGEYY